MHRSSKQRHGTYELKLYQKEMNFPPLFFNYFFQTDPREKRNPFDPLGKNDGCLVAKGDFR